MKKAILFFDVPDTVDVGFIHSMLQQHLLEEMLVGVTSIEILPEQIDSSSRLFFWQRVNDRDLDGTLTEDQKIEMTLRISENDDYLDEKINQSIDYDIEKLESSG
jgi:hypothetical protein